MHPNLNTENGQIGAILSSKAFVQLAFNPLVSLIINRLGYELTLILGVAVLLHSSLCKNCVFFCNIILDCRIIPIHMYKCALNIVQFCYLYFKFCSVSYWPIFCDAANSSSTSRRWICVDKCFR